MGQKYKVFLNDRVIIFENFGDTTTQKPSIRFESEVTVKELSMWFQSFTKSELNEVILIHSSPEKLFTLFKSVFKEVPAAGGVVLSDKEILFILRNGKWDLPKGKIDDGETAAEAALREVEEECGINGHKIVKQLPSTYHIYISPYKKNKGEWIFKETFWFEMTYSGNKTGKPEKSEGITKIEWFSCDMLTEVYENTYGNLKQIISIYCD